MKGARLDVARSKNFLRFRGDALDPLRAQAGRFPNHGSATAGVLMSEAGHANDPGFGAPEYPTYSVPPHLYVTGIAPKATLIPCRVTNSVVLQGDSIPALTKAIYYAIGLNKDDLTVGVVSISLGCVVNRRLLQGALAVALRQAKSNGIVVCAAAGQLFEGAGIVLGPRYPGHDPNAICVAACDSTHGMLNAGCTARWWMSRLRVSTSGGRLSERPAGGGPIDLPSSRARDPRIRRPRRRRLCALAGSPWTDVADCRVRLGVHLRLVSMGARQTCDTRGGTWETAKHGMGVLDVEALLKKEFHQQARAGNLDRQPLS